MAQALIITPFYRPNVGGAETFAEDLAKAISKKYVVHICTIKWKKPILWQGMNLWKALVLVGKLFYPLFRMTEEYEYEKVYALGLIPSFLCALLGLKYSAIILALYNFKKPNLFRYILNRAEKVFVEGLGGEEDMLKVGVKKEKIVKFQHWIDQNRFMYIPKQNNERIKVLFVGRPIWIKGKHIIEDCQKLTEGIDYVYLTDTSPEEMPKHYQMADVVVVPSLYSEGFSRVVVEAASCGCALLTSNKGSLPELVKDFGKCIEPTPDNFANFLVKLKRYRLALGKIQDKTALYALKNFNEKNANCFLL